MLPPISNAAKNCEKDTKKKRSREQNGIETNLNNTKFGQF